MATPSPKTQTPQAQLAGFIDKFAPDVAKQIRFAHAVMKRRWLTAQQMV